MYVLTILFIICQSSQAISVTDMNDKEVPASLLTPISVDFKNMPLKDAISIIAERGKFHLNYNESTLPAGRKVFLKMNKIPAFEVLMKALEGTGTGLVVTSAGQLIIVPSSNRKGEIEGKVTDGESGEPLGGVNIIIPGTQLGAASGRDGRFQIRQIPAGMYTLEVSMIGYERKSIENIVITENAAIEINFEMEEEALSLGEVIVTPGHFSLMEKEPNSSNSLKAEDMRTFPQLGEDIFRAVARLPGVGGNDFSSKFTVRGGAQDEVLILLDGMELYDPFHLKDLDSFLSIVDVEAIRSIDMITGAFPSEYGNRLSGVFNMKTVTPPTDKTRTSLAISFLNFRFRSEGSFGNGKGRWLLVGRRGYLDLLLKRVKQDNIFKPGYYDVLGKVQFFLNSNHSVSAHVLTADDKLKTDFLEEVNLSSGYGNTYGWLTWKAQYHPKLGSQTVLSKARLDREAIMRKAPEVDGDISGDVDDNRELNFYGLKQDWSLELTDNYLLKSQRRIP